MRPLTRMSVLLLSLLTLAAPACAKQLPGRLDPAFGKRGKVVKAVDLEPDTWKNAVTAMARIPRGKVVVLAGKTLLAFRANGRLASSFGGGRVTVSSPGPGSIHLSGIASAPDGRIVVGGSYRSPDFSNPLDPIGEGVFLARYRPDGQLDGSFGSGGIVLTSLGLAPPVGLTPWGPKNWAAPRVTLEGLVVDRQGRIVLGGSRLEKIAFCKTFEFGYQAGFAARLLITGELDPTFGSAGVAALPETESVGGPAVLKSGGVYLSGGDSAPCVPNLNPLLFRLGSNGQRVADFAEGGVLKLPQAVESARGAPALALDAKNRVLFVGPESNPLFPASETVNSVRRILPDGELDRGFGTEGSAALQPANVFARSAIVVDHSGGIVLAGAAVPPSYLESASSSFVVARLTPHGRPDRHFGLDGIVETGFGAQAKVRATGLKVLPHNRILAAGPLARPSLGGGEGIALARYFGR